MGTGEAVRRVVRDDALAFTVLATFLVAGAVWLVHPWYPVEDLAITELEVRRVGSSFPLAGAYSSLPLRHPGPAVFVWSWIPYQLFGERSAALLAATLWFNGAVAAVALATARRLGGHLLAALVAAGIATWSLRLDRPMLLQPWNPYVGALPTVALVLLAWALVEGRPRALVPAVVLGSWMVQAHIQYAPLVAGLLAAGTVALLVRCRAATSRVDRRRLLRCLLGAAAAGLVLWLPVLYDLLANGADSNLAMILKHFREGTDPTITSVDLRNIMRSELSLQPTWAGGPRPYAAYLNIGTSAPPWLLLVGAAALAAAAARRAWTEVRALATAAFALALTYVGISRVTGAIGPWYLIAAEGASVTLAALVVASLLRTAWSGLGAGWTRWRGDRPLPGSPRWAPLTLDGLAVLALVGALLGLHHPRPEQLLTATAQRALPEIEARIGDRPVVVEGRSGLGGWVQAALLLQLEKAGYETRTTTVLTDKYPRDLYRPVPPDAARFVVVTNPPAGTRWRAGVEVIADERIQLRPGERPIHIVIVEAPLAEPRVTEAPSD